MIHLNEAIVGINKKPKRIGSRALKNVVPGDTIYYAYIGIGSGINEFICCKCETTEFSLAATGQYVGKFNVIENIFSTNNTTFSKVHLTNSTGDITVEGGFDENYIIKTTRNRRNSYWLYTTSKQKYDEILERYEY